MTPRGCKHAVGGYDRGMTAAAPSRRFTKALAAFGDVADPLSRLEAVRVAREALEGLERETVAAARASGATWGEIGTLYGVSKQAAQQRFRRPGAAASPHAPTPPGKASGKAKPPKNGASRSR